jgi:hypothetical protein
LKKQQNENGISFHQPSLDASYNAGSVHSGLKIFGIGGLLYESIKTLLKYGSKELLQH